MGDTSDQDPTPNVLSLVQLSITGLEKFVVAQIERVDQVTDRRFQRLDERFIMHNEHGKEISKNETKRLDDIIENIRTTAVETNKQTVATAATVQVTVASTAEAARIKLEATELALRNQNTQSTDALARINAAQNENNEKRFKALEESRSINAGKSSMTTTTIALLSALASSIVMAALSGFVAIVWYVLKH
jgi:hypothetical protein